MKISPRIIELARSIEDPQELIEECQKEGLEINAHQAQRIIEMSEFTEIDEDDLEMVSGGCGDSGDGGGGSKPDCPLCNSNAQVSTSWYEYDYYCNTCKRGFNENGEVEPE